MTKLQYQQNNKNSQHGKHKPGYYAENKQKYRLANQRYRAKLKSKKPPKLPSDFQLKKLIKFLKTLVNYRSFVPVPYGLKHPILKN
jgi:hypothetical protein